MKNIFNKLTTVLATLAFSAATFATTVTYNPTSVGITSVVSSDVGAITSIQFVNNATNVVTVGLFNAPTNVLTYVIGAYTNSVITTGTTITTFTNYYGIVQHSTNSTMTTAAGPVAQTTNNYPKMLTYAIPASTTVNLPLTPGMVFLSGLAATNSATNIVLTINYAPVR